MTVSHFLEILAGLLNENGLLLGLIFVAALAIVSKHLSKCVLREKLQ